MIDFLYITYQSTFKLDRHRGTRLLGKVFRKFIWALFPSLAQIALKRKSAYSAKKNENVYVSLTSFPARIRSVHLVIKSLLAQSITPARIDLWLSADQFNGKSSLPKNLLDLQSDVFRIHLVEDDIGPHKKYYYAYHTTKNLRLPLITVDDDIIYPSWLIEALMESFSKDPEKISAHRCTQISELVSYDKWNVVKSTSPMTSKTFLPTGCGGVLYPPDSLPNITFDKEIFMGLAPKADDIWLNACAYSNGISVKYTGKFCYFLPAERTPKEPLYIDNLNGGNDKTLKSVNDYFVNNFGLDILLRAE